MAYRCRCHEKLTKAMAAGASFDEAYRKHHKSGYHSHACDCACGCNQDTQGYALCPSCDFGDCKDQRDRRYRWDTK